MYVRIKNLDERRFGILGFFFFVLLLHVYLGYILRVLCSPCHFLRLCRSISAIQFSYISLAILLLAVLSSLPAITGTIVERGKNICREITRYRFMISGIDGSTISCIVEAKAAAPLTYYTPSSAAPGIRSIPSRRVAEGVVAGESGGGRKRRRDELSGTRGRRSFPCSRDSRFRRGEPPETRPSHR